MAIEVEQKFRVDDAGALEARLLALGATPSGDDEQVDCYYRHPVRDFAQTDEALRLRRVGPHNYLTYKGPKLDPTMKTRREIELALPAGETSADQAAQLLAALSFEAVLEVRKQRRSYQLDWQGQSVEIALDRVAEVGQFVELEIVVEEDCLQQARETVASLAGELQLSGSERRSYLELLLAARNSHSAKS